MNIILIKALIVLVVGCLIFLWSFKSFYKKQSLGRTFQLIGSTFLIIVAIVHIFEAEQWFEFMHWGSPHSIGHYLDLSSAILGLVLFFTGLVFSKLLKK